MNHPEINYRILKNRGARKKGLYHWDQSTKLGFFWQRIDIELLKDVPTFIITGSFNFSKAQEKNAENLLILKNPELAGKYIDNFLKHKTNSEKLMPRR